jgi:hypothetical protein
MRSAHRAASALGTQNELSSILSGIVNSFQNVTSTYVQNLFSGQGNYINQLAAQLANGKWLNNGLGTSNTDNLYGMKNIMMNTFYGLLLPKAWKNNPNVHPFIL